MLKKPNKKIKMKKIIKKNCNFRLLELKKKQKDYLIYKIIYI